MVLYIFIFIKVFWIPRKYECGFKWRDSSNILLSRIYLRGCQSDAVTILNTYLCQLQLIKLFQFFKHNNYPRLRNTISKINPENSQLKIIPIQRKAAIFLKFCCWFQVILSTHNNMNRAMLFYSITYVEITYYILFTYHV